MIWKQSVLFEIKAETDAHFKAAAAAVQHIVYMDRLWKLMVSHSQNLGGGGRDGSSRSGAYWEND